MNLYKFKKVFIIANFCQYRARDQLSDRCFSRRSLEGAAIDSPVNNESIQTNDVRTCDHLAIDGLDDYPVFSDVYPVF